MGHSSLLNAACVVAFACAISALPVRAQDCEPRMLTGPEFALDGVLGTAAYSRVGTTWDPDGPGPLGEVIVIAGEFQVPGLNICTWDGRQLAPLGDGLDGIVRALAVYNGQLIAGGEFIDSGTGLAAPRLAAWNGSTWESFGGGADNTVYALHIHNGELYAAGRFGTIGGQAIPRLARWDGAQWHALGESPLPLTSGTTVRALATHQGDLYVGGNFDSIGGVDAASIARWDGKSWSPLDNGVPGNGVVHALHSSALAGEPQLLVGGVFQQAGGQARVNFARWTGSSWITPDTYFLGPVFGFAEFAGRVIAAGAFGAVVDNAQFPVLPARAFAQWDGQHWTALNPPLGGNAEGQALAVYNNELLLGGNIGIAQWEGPGDSIRPIGDEVQSITTSIDYNGRLVAAGYFHFDDLRIVTGLAEWDGARWRPFGDVPVAVNSVARLGVEGDSLVVFGDFTEFAGIPAAHVARWSNGAWQSMGTLQHAARGAGRANGQLYAAVASTLFVWDGAAWQAVLVGVLNIDIITEFQGRLTVAGGFDASAGAARIMQFSDKDSSWVGLPLPGGDIGIPNGAVTGVEVLGDQLLIAGTFTSAFGLDCGRLVIWNGTEWVCPGIAAAYDIAPTPDGVLVAGSFDVPGAPGYRNLALWNGAALVPITADNPTISGASSARIASLAGEALIFASQITSADGRIAYDWTRITRDDGVPAIAQQPQSGAFSAGDTISLAVSIPSGYEPVSYQWRKGKLDLADGPGGAGGSGVVSGATTATLAITNVSAADAGSFTVLMTTECGDIVSDAAAVDIFCVADFNRDSVVNSTDVSDFINAWFQDQHDGTLVTDFNHDGVVNSTDVSDFINAWFDDTSAGCG